MPVVALLRVTVVVVSLCFSALGLPENEKDEHRVSSTSEACARIISDLEIIRNRLAAGMKDWSAVCANHGFSDDLRCLTEIPIEERSQAPVIKLTLSLSTLKALMAVHLHSIGQILVFSSAELTELVGETASQEVERKLLKHGLVLKEE